MSFFKKIFGIKEKPQTFTINLFDKDYVIDVSPEGLEIMKNTSNDEEDTITDYKALRQAQIDTYETNVVKHYFLDCLFTINEINYDYFTHDAKIEKVTENLSKIKELPVDKYLELGKIEAKRVFESNYSTLDENMIFVIENPLAFLMNIDKFHKQVLIKSIKPFCDVWRIRVVELKQKAAKTKRKQYVIDGLWSIKIRLISLGANSHEISIVDEFIEKIINEDWSLI